MAAYSEHPTRQQLDDLEALMQRMLALPVDPVEENAGPVDQAKPAAAERQPAPSPTIVSAGRLPEGRVEVIVSETGPQIRMDRPQAIPSPFAVPAAPARALADPPGPKPPPAAPLTADPARAAVKPPVVITALPAPIFVPRVLRPLVRINNLYDATTRWLGPPGRWLRSQGRTLLGWTGLALLIAAAAWVALDWIGWIW